MTFSKTCALTIALTAAVTGLSAFAAPGSDAGSTSVTAVPVEKLVIHPQVTAPAVVRSLGDSRVGVEVSASVRAIPVRVGDTVEAGSVLVELDDGEFKLAVAELEGRLAATEAQIGFARQQYLRSQTLTKQHSISQEMLDERASTLAELLARRNADRAALDIARRRLDKCVVRAPFRAVVLEQLANLGEFVTPGQALVRVMDLDHLEVSAQVLAEDAEVLEHSPAIVFRHAGRDYPLVLRVVTPVIDPLTRTRQVRLEFNGEPALPGASGRLVWQTVAALPANLLVRREGRLGVLLAEHDRAAFHPLPDAEEGRPASASALPPGSLVITDGRLALSNGDAVRVVE